MNANERIEQRNRWLEIVTEEQHRRRIRREAFLGRAAREHAVRRMIEAAEQVRVLEIAECPFDEYRYLIETAFNFPKFVIGITDAEGRHAGPVYSCGLEQTARDQWEKLRNNPL